MKRLIISLFALVSFSSVAQINLATRPYQDTNIKVLRQIRSAVAAGGGTTVVTGSVTVLNPSVTVLNPSVSIIGTPTVVVSGVVSGTFMQSQAPNSALTVTVFSAINVANIKIAFDVWRAANPTKKIWRTEYSSVNPVLRELIVEFE